jgi:uncharacterized phiE125 gp8 family phage protein
MTTLLTPPAAEPVSLADAKLAARVDGTALDALIPALITAAREQAEQIAAQRFVTQTWRHELTDWPAADQPLPQHGATAVAISYWSGTAWTVLPAEAFEFAAAPFGGGTLLAPALGTAWPVLGERAVSARVRVDITSGGPADQVPQCVRLFILATVAHWIDNPGAQPANGRAEISPLYERLLDPVRIYA